MEKLSKKLILEFLEDTDVQDVSIDALDIDTPIEEPIEVKQEKPVATPLLSEPEKVNFIVSILTDLSQRFLDLFNYLTPIINNELDKDTLSEQNKDLLNSIYEDISLTLGKVQQGIKDNSPENIAQAIDDGQTKAQETITPEPTLEEDLKSDKEKLWDDLSANVDMGDYFDKMKEHEDEEEERFFKDTKKALQDWKHYYSENQEMLDKIKAFEDKYFKE